MQINFDKINSDNYIKIAKIAGLKYFDEFIEAFNILKLYLSENQQKDLLENKLLLKQSNFDKNKFIQYAVEMSVIRFFAENFGENFQYEKKSNPNNNTDVDCTISDGKYKFNIEVKTPILDKKDVNISPGLKGRSLGRLPDGLFESISKAFDKALHIPEGSSNIINFDNKLKQFLIDANKKFNPQSNHSKNEANILILGLDDIVEIIIWINYLGNAGNGGLFTSNSFFDPKEYERVDFVVFTNLYFKHKNAITDKCLNHWDLKHSFVIMYNNPMVNSKKRDVLEHFLKLCPNHNAEIGEYKAQIDEPVLINDFFKLKFFVEDELERKRGIYLFEKESQ